MQATHQHASPTGAVRIRRDVLRDRRNQAGMTSNRALAERMGVDQSTLQRVIGGQAEPSARFIASVLRALPGTRFEDLFGDESPATQK